jgi:hypothetical protein
MTFLLAAQISASSTNGLSLSLGLFAYKSRAVNEHSLSSPLLSETHDGSQQRSLYNSCPVTLDSVSQYSTIFCIPRDADCHDICCEDDLSGQGFLLL